MCTPENGASQVQKSVVMVSKSTSGGTGPIITESSASGTNEKEPFISLMKGIQADVKARAPLYLDDWNVRSYKTVINATFYVFIIQLVPALVFAELIDRSTEGKLGTAELLLSSGIMGIIYAIFAGQPLVIMGISGPVVVMLGTSAGLATAFGADYFPFFFWICIWAGLMHCISAAIGLVTLVWTVTPFTSQIYELFIAITFIYTSLYDLLEPIQLLRARSDTAADDRGIHHASLFLGMMTFAISSTLHSSETWIFFNRKVRAFLTEYNTAIAVVVVTAVSFLPGFDQSHNGKGGLDRVNVRVVPWDWMPTADRSWLVHPFNGIDARGIFGAMIPGFMFFLLFIIDHNVSSILTQIPKYNLKKPSTYHLDFFVVGITFLPCAILGLPPGNALIPQGPLHCRALCMRKFETDKFGVKREVLTQCEEQRWSGLGQSLLMLGALSAFTVLSWIPRGCLFGLLLYLGMGTLHGNEIWERITFSFIASKRRPATSIVRNVSWRKVQIFTALQVACAATIFSVATFASMGYIYPALLTMLVPFRSHILPQYFSEEDLKHLDPTNESVEQYDDEQRLIRDVERMGTTDECVTSEPHIQAFRPGGLRKQLCQRHHIDTLDLVEANDTVSSERGRGLVGEENPGCCFVGEAQDGVITGTIQVSVHGGVAVVKTSNDTVSTPGSGCEDNDSMNFEE